MPDRRDPHRSGKKRPDGAEASPEEATTTGASEAADEGAPSTAPGTGDSEGGAEASTGDELDEARRQADEYLAHLQRLKAEFENYRKRVIREQTRAVEFATEPLVSRLLEVLDDFELALVAAEQRPDFDKFLRGVEIVYAKLADLLKAEGLERIEAEGKPFDPTEHEALFQAEGGEGEPYVADVLRPGYRLKGRVIRPAGVKVARR